MTQEEMEQIAALVAEDLMGRIVMRERIAAVRDKAIERLRRRTAPAGKPEVLRAVYGAIQDEKPPKEGASSSKGSSIGAAADPALIDMIAQAVVDKLAEEAPVSALTDQVAARVLLWRDQAEQTNGAR